MQWSMGQGGGGSNPDVIAQVYKTLVGQKRLSNYGTDFNSGASGTTQYGVMICRNFTVNTGHTITMGGTANSPAIIICDTLTVNGILNAGTYTSGGASSNGSGAGGGGGRALYIFARQILGTGTIASNGVSGSNGIASTLSSSYSSGSSGQNAYLPFANGTTPSAGSYGTTLTAAVAGTPAIGTTGIGGSNELLLRFPTWFMGGYNIFNATNYNWISGNNSWGGTGASGASGNYTTTAYMYGGGSGGGSAIASGGTGGVPSGTSTVAVTGGGGGGGAGHIYIFTESPFPAINLQVAGGVGGNSYGQAGGGGGGAGGYIGLWCPTGSPASTVVTGGAAGTNSGGGGTAPTAGGNGAFDQFAFAA